MAARAEPRITWKTELFLFTLRPGCAHSILIVVSEGKRLQSGYILHSPEQNTESHRFYLAAVSSW